MTHWEKAEDALGLLSILIVLAMILAGGAMLSGCTPSLPEEDTARFWEEYLEERDGSR